MTARLSGMTGAIVMGGRTGRLSLTGVLKTTVDKPQKSGYNRNNTNAGKGGATMYTTVRGSFFYFSYRFTGYAYRKAVLRCTG